ncbi:MAG: hypothetical protein PVH61_30925 [Candidatus Aminicenantes bacterium]
MHRILRVVIDTNHIKIYENVKIVRIKKFLDTLEALAMENDVTKNRENKKENRTVSHDA